MKALFGIAEFVLGKPLVALGVALAFAAMLGGAYLKIRGDGYDAGVSMTSAKYEKLMADQKSANEQAIADAETFINHISNRLKDLATEKANADALQELDAAVAADTGCGAERVPADIVRSINAVK